MVVAKHQRKCLVVMSAVGMGSLRRKPVSTYTKEKVQDTEQNSRQNTKTEAHWLCCKVSHVFHNPILFA